VPEGLFENGELGDRSSLIVVSVVELVNLQIAFIFLLFSVDRMESSPNPDPFQRYVM
jgi:hypothetical protein